MSENTQTEPIEDVPSVDKLSIGKVAAMLRVSVKTLQRWDDNGKLKALRNAKNRRYYLRNDIIEFIRSNDKLTYVRGAAEDGDT